MGFFSTKRKKTDNVKTLTETEIQQRLYGHLRTPSTEVEDPASESAASSFSIRRPSEAETTPIKTQDTLSAGQKTVSSGATASGPASKGSWSDSSTKSAFNKPKTEKKKNVLGPVVLFVFKFVKNILFVLLMGVFKAIETVFRFFASIDLRKPAVKRIASIAGAAAFIGLLFFSTTFLNVQREAAMKAPNRKPIAERTRPAAPPQAEVAAPLPPDALSSSAIPESGAAESADEDPTDTEAPSDDSESEETAAVESAPKPKPAAVNAYSIQIATFAAREDASNLVTRFKDQNIDAFVKSLERPGGKIYYCVFVGRYKDYRDADENLARFKKKPFAKPFQDAFVRALKTE